MGGDTKKLSPMQYMAQHSEDTQKAFQAMRKAVMAAGPLDHNTCELIVLGAFATARVEMGFKVHAKRLLADGVDIAAIRQAVMVTLGATTAFNVCIEAMRWIDEAAADG